MDIEISKEVELIKYLSVHAIQSGTGKKFYCFYKGDLLVSDTPQEMKQLLNMIWE